MPGRPLLRRRPARQGPRRDLEPHIDDPTLSSGIGTASYRQGLVYFLLGDYTNAVQLWQDRAIAPLRNRRSADALMAGQALLTGEPVASVRTMLDLPGKVNIQAEWEFELAHAALEGGLPVDLVADHFQEALKLEPALTVRPLIAYYLEMLGKPVPPPRPTAATAPAAKPAEPAPTPTPTPPDAKPGLPANPFATDPARPAEPATKPNPDLPDIPLPPGKPEAPPKP